MNKRAILYSSFSLKTNANEEVYNELTSKHIQDMKNQCRIC